MESAPEEISKKCSLLNGKNGKLDLYDLGINNSYVRVTKKYNNLSEEKQINDILIESKSLEKLSNPDKEFILDCIMIPRYFSRVADA